MRGHIPLFQYFDGWTAYDIIGPLNKREVRAVLLDFEIQKSNFRDWDSVERMILGSSDEVKNVLFRCGEAKRNVEMSIKFLSSGKMEMVFFALFYKNNALFCKIIQFGTKSRYFKLSKLEHVR